MAFLTLRHSFQALLYYLYTNEIEFAQWGSAERRKARAREETTEPFELPKPSPKSIYRLADKVGTIWSTTMAETDLIISTTFRH